VIRDSHPRAQGRRKPPSSHAHLLWATVLSALEEDADAPALLGGERTRTYADLARASARGAREIDARVAPGSRLLVAAYDQQTAALAFLAALGSRSIPLLVDPLSAAGLERIARRFRVAGALGERRLLGSLGIPLVDENRIRSWIETKGGEGSLERFELPAVRADEPAFWTFTSGTTGEPRAVVHGHRGPVAAFEAFGRGIVRLGRGDRTIATAGLPFVYALGNAFLFPLLARGAAILPSDLLLPSVLGALQQHAATVLVSGPWSLEAMVRLADRDRWRDGLRALRIVLSAGEALPPAVFLRWRDTFGQPIVDNLGCTEMFNSFLAAPAEEARPGSLGRVVPGFDVRVGVVAPRPHARGALAVRGESRAVAMSVDGESERIEPVDGEWCETGDEVAVEADGRFRFLGRVDDRFRFLGRVDDRFKVRGQFVHPLEIERSLLEVEGVRECLVFPEESPDGLSGIAAHVVLDEGLDPVSASRRLAAHVRTRLDRHLRALRLEIVAALPRSARGKLTRPRSAAARG